MPAVPESYKKKVARNAELKAKADAAAKKAVEVSYCI